MDIVGEYSNDDQLEEMRKNAVGSIQDTVVGGLRPITPVNQPTSVEELSPALEQLTFRGASAAASAPPLSPLPSVPSVLGKSSGRRSASASPAKNQPRNLSTGRSGRSKSKLNNFNQNPT